MRRAQDGWADVSLKNAVVFLAACASMNINPQIILEALPRGVARTRDAMAKAWCSLTQFNRIMNVLVGQLGHPAHLIEVGRYSGQVSFGFEYVQRWLLKGFARWFTSPSLGIDQIPTAAASFNSNKRWSPLLKGKAARRRQLFLVDFVHGPNGEEPRSALEDRRSLVHFVRGVLQAIAPMWPWQGKVGRVCYRVVQIPAVEFIQAEMPCAEVRWVRKSGRMHVADEISEPADNQLEVDGVVYAEVISLVADAELEGRYLGACLEDGAPRNGQIVPAVRMLQDLRTECERTGEMLPLMRAGEVYEYPDAPLPGTIIEMKWKNSLPIRFLNWLGKSIFHPLLNRSLAQESRTAEAEARASDAELRQRLGAQHLLLNFPNPEIAQQVTRGTFEERTIRTCAMFVDIVGSTELRLRMQDNEWVALLQRLMDGHVPEIVRDHGGWYYNPMGDGGVSIFTNGWERPPTKSMQECVRGALFAARHIRQVAQEEEGIELRIGIHVGDVTWFPSRSSFRIDGSGPGLDNAKRIESITEDGTLAVSEAAFEVLGDTRHFDASFGSVITKSDKHDRPHRFRVMLKTDHPHLALISDEQEEVG